jgi:thymidylate kinase
MHIAIEGIDGVGKTTTAIELSKRLNYILVEKPLHYLFDDGELVDNYIKIRDKVNENKNKKYTAWFYGLGNIYLYEKFKDMNIITDRHILSNYSWSGDSSTNYIFNSIIKTIGMPNYTFILYANEEVLKSRLKNRDENDNDFSKTKYNKIILKKMITLSKRYKIPHLLIDTSNLTTNEICDLMIATLKEKGVLIDYE